MVFTSYSQVSQFSFFEFAIHMNDIRCYRKPSQTPAIQESKISSPSTSVRVRVQDRCSGTANPPNAEDPAKQGPGRLLSIIKLLHPKYILIERLSFHLVLGMGKFGAKPSISKFHAHRSMICPGLLGQQRTAGAFSSGHSAKARSVFTAKD